MGSALPNLGIPTGPRFYDAALEGLTLVNMEIMQDGDLPPLYEAGVKYQPTADRQWRVADQIVIEGWADCEGLAPYRAAELRLSGEDSNARVVTYRTGPKKFHAVVERHGGAYIEDPSAVLGMAIKNPTSYVNRLVDNFGPDSVSGDDGENPDDFYNAPPPYEGGDPADDAISNFYALDPSYGEMGPGVGPAEPSGGGGGGSDSGGGGGGSPSSGSPSSPNPSDQKPRRGDGTDRQFPARGNRPWGRSQQGDDSGRGDGGAPTMDQAGAGRPHAQPRPMPAPRPTSAASSSSSGSWGAKKKPAAARTTTPSRKPTRKAPKSKGKGWVKGVSGIYDKPTVYIVGDEEDWQEPPDVELGPDDFGDLPPLDAGPDERDVGVDIHEVPESEGGGFVSTVHIPMLVDGQKKTAVAQSSRSSTAKNAAKKALNIAKLAAGDSTVQKLVAPQAATTLAIIKSDTAKKIYHSLFG